MALIIERSPKALFMEELAVWNIVRECRSKRGFSNSFSIREIPPHCSQADGNSGSKGTAIRQFAFSASSSLQSRRAKELANRSVRFDCYFLLIYWIRTFSLEPRVSIKMIQIVRANCLEQNVQKQTHTAGVTDAVSYLENFKSKSSDSKKFLHKVSLVWQTVL